MKFDKDQSTANGKHTPNTLLGHPEPRWEWGYLGYIIRRRIWCYVLWQSSFLLIQLQFCDRRWFSFFENLNFESSRSNNNSYRLTTNAKRFYTIFYIYSPSFITILPSFTEIQEFEVFCKSHLQNRKPDWKKMVWESGFLPLAPERNIRLSPFKLHWT